MLVIKFYSEEDYWAYAAETKELALKQFTEDTGEECTKSEEIPESQWDEQMITVYPDNDLTKKPFKISIREAICGTEPQMIFSNDAGY